ncbi:MAG: non-canonical purine NTP diphosphatase [Bacteroidota bacterium]|nr:non-canonical purine NTP diphosphatase [Bacteroidota bacterium]
MIDLVFATNNKHKLKELSRLTGNKFHLLSLKDLNCNDDIPETADTLEGNAALKARYIWEKFGKNCFADDTGLEVEALNGRPGVYSARYAGEEQNAELNVSKVLEEMIDRKNRSARFRTVFCLIIEGREYFFEGIVNGNLISERRGNEGFGYDPIFIPDGFDQTFAQMPLALKNKISHRGQATEKLLHFLKSL